MPKSKRPNPNKNKANKPEGVRLQKVLAEAGVASRRASEELILNGSVTVNGELVTELPAWVRPGVDRIVVDGHPIAKQAPRLYYLLLNKPARVLCTAEDEPGANRKTVLDLIANHPDQPRLFPIGRLDYDTLGLVILTNDGELANRLTHPRYGVPKTYRAKIKGVLTDEDVQELENGIYLAERKAGQTVGAVRTSRVELKVTHRLRSETWLEVTLREGRNRQVRRMFAAVGHPVVKLERIAMGPLQLKGVARGAWRELKAPELHALRRAGAAPKKSKKTSTKTGGSGGNRPPKTPKKGMDAPETGGSENKPVRRRAIKNAVNRGGRKS